MKLHSVSINLSKIRKERIIEGKKGKYLNLTIAEHDEKDQYGNNVQIWEGQSEEERKAKADRNFLGNGKTIYVDQKESSEVHTQNAPPEEDNSLPF